MIQITKDIKKIIRKHHPKRMEELDQMLRKAVCEYHGIKWIDGCSQCQDACATRLRIMGEYNKLIEFLSDEGKAEVQERIRLRKDRR